MKKDGGRKEGANSHEVKRDVRNDCLCVTHLPDTSGFVLVPCFNDIRLSIQIR